MNVLILGIIVAAIAVPSLVLYLWMTFVIHDDSTLATIIHTTATTLTLITTILLILLLTYSLPVVSVFYKEGNNAVYELKNKGYQVERNYDNDYEAYIIHLNSWLYLEGKLE